MRYKRSILSYILTFLLLTGSFWSVSLTFAVSEEPIQPNSNIQATEPETTDSNSEATTPTAPKSKPNANAAAVAATDATYKITTSVNSISFGSITASSTVVAGSSVTISVIPKSGYYLSDLQVDGKSAGALYVYVFTDIQEAHTVKAIFSKSIKVMLDAGHAGKYNKSPVYPSYYESEMNWALHNYLKAELLKYNGFQVGVTRSVQTTDMEVYYRGTASKGYDLFLSLHSNAAGSSTADYPLIITQKGDTKHALAKALGKTIQTTMGTKQNYQTWQRLNADGKTEYYGVLRGSKAVGTLGMILEHSFHTNLAATKWLSDQNNLKEMAQAEADVIAKQYGLKLLMSTPIVSSTQKVKVLVDDLHMRECYSDESNSMGLVNKDEIYQLKAKTKDGKWGQLKINGYWIYLKSGFTQVIKEDPNIVSSKEKRKVLIKGLNMRKSYTSSSKIMGKAKKNKTYQLIAKTKNGNWGQLKSNGYWIYLKGGYTKKV